jgi:hypothetical protein
VILVRKGTTNLETRVREGVKAGGDLGQDAQAIAGTSGRLAPSRALSRKCGFQRQGGLSSTRSRSNGSKASTGRLLSVSLLKSVDAGFRNAAELRIDPLREREDFKKVLAEVENKSADKTNKTP